jgi:uncharacterized paraquat-inducible protein A
MTDALKNWVMVALTLIFVVLYAAALLGWLKPLSDVTIVTRLEPIIFVIIGYFFGRLPTHQNEKTLKEEINRQTQKADAAQHAKEQALQVRESLEEKVKNAKEILTSVKTQANNKIETNIKNNEGLQIPFINAAINILNS